MIAPGRPRPRDKGGKFNTTAQIESILAMTAKSWLASTFIGETQVIEVFSAAAGQRRLARSASAIDMLLAAMTAMPTTDQPSGR